MKVIEGKHLGDWKLLPAREGKCSECGSDHDPAMPHNGGSMFYQYHFYNEHGRWPSWLDAMAHCTVEVAAIWYDQLVAMGVDVMGGGLHPEKKNRSQK